MEGKAEFASKIGLIAATVGSAVGLGTIWRFPNEVQENGGSVFLLAYLAAVLLVGIPVMLAEFSLGRGSGCDAIGSFRKLTPGKKWWLVGALGVLTPYLILMYYNVVSGWTLNYLWMSITGSLFDGVNNGAPANESFQQIMEQSLTSTWQPLIWTTIIIFVNIFVLLNGVQKGIERMSNIMMPVLFVILLIFCGVSLNLPNSMEGVKFFLSPDWSKIDSNVFIEAIGQAFFSMSLGMGILITYSSYYPKDTNLSHTAATVSFSGLLVAVLVGLIIFPAIKSFGIEGSTQGATLIFVTLPQILMQLPCPQFWAILFFALMVVAALTSNVSIAEVSIALLCDTFKMSRRKATLLTLLPMFVFSTVCALSMGPWSDFEIFGFTIFNGLDFFTSNILLPIVSIGVCLYVGFVLPKSFFVNEIDNGKKLNSKWAQTVLFFVRFVSPVLIILAFANKLFQ